MRSPTSFQIPVLRVTEHNIPVHPIDHLKDGHYSGLILAVRQYTPNSNSPTPSSGKLINVIAVGDNSFPKELYEPLFEEIYLRCRDQGYHIANFWMADPLHQGDSGIQNAAVFGKDSSALAFMPGIYTIMEHFQPTGWIHGLGHGLGGASLFDVVLTWPNIFSGLILYEPILSIEGMRNPSPEPAESVVPSRPRSWLDKESAENWFRQREPYKSWNPRVLADWMKYALKEDKVRPSAVELITDRCGGRPTYLSKPFVNATSEDPAKERKYLDEKKEENPLVWVPRTHGVPHVRPGHYTPDPASYGIIPPVLFVHGAAPAPDATGVWQDMLNNATRATGIRIMPKLQQTILQDDKSEKSTDVRSSCIVFEKVEKCAEVAATEIVRIRKALDDDMRSRFSLEEIAAAMKWRKEQKEYERL